MYYYKDSSKNIIYVKSKESLSNLITQNIINQNTEIRIGLRGAFIEAKNIDDLKNLFGNNKNFKNDLSVEDQEIKDQEKDERPDNLSEIIEEIEDTNSDMEIIEESSIKNNIESPWNNEMSEEVEHAIKIPEEEIVEKENIVEELSEQEQHQESEHKKDEIIYGTEDHASAYVSFPKAVKLAFKNYFNFSDRSSRSEYWYFTLFMILIVIGTTFLAALMPSEVFAIILPIGYVVCLIPSLSLGVRRLHDTDRRGWYILIGIIPLIGEIFLIIMFALSGNIKENRFGVKTLGAE